MAAGLVRACILGMHIGDALAMPVHWYYSLDRLAQDFPPHGVTGYAAPPARFLGSILNLSNTGGGGRGSDKGTIVGDVILKGKKQFWKRGGNYHYHHGMQPGENTLEMYLTRLIMDNVAEHAGEVDAGSIREAYVAFMTREGSHNDTYAATAHRMFFENMHSKGRPLDQCPDNDGHNVDAIDGLSNLPPVVCSGFLRGKSDAAIHADAQATVSLFRRSAVLPKYAAIYTDLLLDVLRGSELRPAVQAAAGKLGLRLNSKAADPMVACYIDGAFAALLHLLNKYGDDPEAALLANANAGGENVARGTLLGAVIGAAHGEKGLPVRLVEGLVARETIEQSIANFVASAGCEA